MSSEIVGKQLGKLSSGDQGTPHLSEKIRACCSRPWRNFTRSSPLPSYNDISPTSHSQSQLCRPTCSVSQGLKQALGSDDSHPATGLGQGIEITVPGTSFHHALEYQILRRQIILDQILEISSFRESDPASGLGSTL
jgi:hypothetical protein